MNKKDFLKYNEALELKELGFDNHCFGVFYSSQDELKFIPTDVFDVKIFHDKGFLKVPTYSEAFDWFEEHFGLYVEWLIEGWGDDECISKPSYRVFIWEVGKPKPSPSDDLGGGTREQMNPEVVRGLIQIAKLGPDWDSLNGFEMDELD